MLQSPRRRSLCKFTHFSHSSDEANGSQPDIKKMQIQLTGFLDKDAAGFCKELWKLCLSAQSNPQGVPKELLEAKKLELIQEKVDCTYKGSRFQSGN